MCFKDRNPAVSSPAPSEGAERRNPGEASGSARPPRPPRRRGGLSAWRLLRVQGTHSAERVARALPAAAWSLPTLLPNPSSGSRWGLRTSASPAGPTQMSCCDQAPAWLCSEISPEPRGSRRPPPGHRRPSAAGAHGGRGPSVTPRVHLLWGPRCPPLSDHELLFVERKEASETGGWAPRSLGRRPAGPGLLPPLLTVLRPRLLVSASASRARLTAQ